MHRRPLRLGGWAAVVAAVVLVARVLAYALAPDPRAEALGRVTGGPRPVVVAIVALTLAALLAGGVLWVSALGVRERHRLRRPGAAPRLAVAPVLARALCVSLVAATSFTVLESLIHLHEGLGFHGLHCVLGPVHEDALPLIGALSLVAVAIVEAVRHAVSFGRRIVAAGTGHRRIPRGARSSALAAPVPGLPCFCLLCSPTGRGPPAPSFR